MQEQRTGDRGEGRRGRRAVVVGATLALVAAVATVALVRRGGGGADAEPVGPRPSTVPSPFEVVDPPAGFALVRVGTGTAPPTFASDVDEPHEGYTLLSPDGEVGPDVVAVSYQGIYDGSNPAVPPGVEPVHLDADEVGGRGWWSEGRQVRDLGLLRRRHLAVRVSSSTPRSRAEMLAIARAVPLPPAEVTDVELRRRPPPPPAVGDGFAGLRVVGRVSSATVTAMLGYGLLGGSLGPTGARIQLWRDGTGTTVGVGTIAGHEADLRVLGRHPWFDPRIEELDGGPAGRPLVRAHCERWACEALVTTTDAGDLLVVSTWAGTAPGARAAMRSFTRVRSVGEARWDELADRAFGGPGLHPDPGAEEVARGGEGDDAWLLQTPPAARYDTYDGEDELAAGPDGVEPGLTLGDLGLGPCLKFADRSRGCAHPLDLRAGYPGVEALGIARPAGEAGALRPVGVTLLLVSGYPTAASARISVAEVRDGVVGDDLRFEEVVSLRPTPAGGARYAVVDAELVSLRCGPARDLPARTAMAVSSVELLDGAGRNLACATG